MILPLTFLLLKETLIDYPTYGVACCVPFSMVIKDFRNLDEEEIKYVILLNLQEKNY